VLAHHPTAGESVSRAFVPERDLHDALAEPDKDNSNSRCNYTAPAPVIPDPDHIAKVFNFVQENPEQISNFNFSFFCARPDAVPETSTGIMPLTMEPGVGQVSESVDSSAGALPNSPNAIAANIGPGPISSETVAQHTQPANPTPVPAKRKVGRPRKSGPAKAITSSEQSSGEAVKAPPPTRARQPRKNALSSGPGRAAATPQRPLGGGQSGTGQQLTRAISAALATTGRRNQKSQAVASAEVLATPTRAAPAYHILQTNPVPAVAHEIYPLSVNASTVDSPCLTGGEPNHLFAQDTAVSLAPTSSVGERLERGFDYPNTYVDGSRQAPMASPLVLPEDADVDYYLEWVDANWDENGIPRYGSVALAAQGFAGGTYTTESEDRSPKRRMLAYA
jgi:hypothetical protein